MLLQASGNISIVIQRQTPVLLFEHINNSKEIQIEKDWV